MSPNTYTLADFDYDLPPELIAQTPARERSASRLLHVDGTKLRDLTFTDLPSLLDAGDLAVFNDTRVINARIHGRKPTGGEVEMLVERITGTESAIVQLRASHPPRVGGSVELPAGARATVEARDGRFFNLRFEGVGALHRWLELHGAVPLPPYITHAPDAADAERYQTVYARVRGAVAAPTAGLHFDAPLLDALAKRGVAQAFVTLHVGAGTFQPVQAEQLSRHRMHSETFEIPQATVDAIGQTRARGGRVVAVGTTTLRALESAADESGGLRAGSGDTALFITPGYRFRTVDRLVTNFHLPRSTLLMLVSAFAGYDTIRRAYAHAIAQRYRFMSYGDAMLLEGGQARRT
ncbi:MAG: tRNA preQ1(34) S-adenosylmethionine ribosyltransferase-isomerase QueA [Betaproteobacteria bacterium]|nr:tRNA preQ1(34) S-adenosylmethionine ribosyltransferase-isomerase QueA [Betaproteobacteria bacterium]